MAEGCTKVRGSATCLLALLICSGPASLSFAKTKEKSAAASASKATKASRTSEPATQILQQIYDQSCRSGKARCASDGVVRGTFADDLRKAYLDVVGNEANAKRVKDGAIKDVIDFDVFTDTKEYRITELRVSTIAASKPEADKSTARADFKNNGAPMHLEFDLVRTGETWKITNIHWRHRDTSLRSLIAVLQAK